MPQNAIGIPDREDYGDLDKLSPKQLVDWIVQKHVADRAGIHEDIRIGDKDTGLFSWASRKGLPATGEKRLAVQQPVHDHSYGSFEGTIQGGYGAGNVSILDKGQALISHADQNKINLTLASKRNPQRYSFIRPSKPLDDDTRNWLLLNTTESLNKLPAVDKLKYKSVAPDNLKDMLENMQTGSSLQPKTDGASSLTHLLKDKLEVLSFRKSKAHGGNIAYTEKMFGKVPEINPAKEYIGSVLGGELYANKDNKPLPVQELSGLLNSTIANSLKTQQDQGIKFRNMLFDVRRLGNKPIDIKTTPYSKRIELLHKILDSIGGKDAQLVKDMYHLPEEAKTKEEALKLLDTVSSGKHKLTREGVVYWPDTGVPTKAKMTKEWPVYIRDIMPGKNRLENVGAGAFSYSHTPDGPIVGEVGSGIDDVLRKDMLANKAQYLGRLANVKATNKMPSNALFQPSLHSISEDYPSRQ